MTPILLAASLADQTCAQPIWVNQTPALKAAAFGRNAWVVVGEQGQVFYSSKGQEWVRGGSGFEGSLNDVVFAQGRFVAVGASHRNGLGAILSSADGVFWSVATDGIAAPMRKVAFGAGRFVAVGGTVSHDDCVNRLLTSEDGERWVERDTGLPSFGGAVFLGRGLYSVAYGSSGFVAVGGGVGTASWEIPYGTIILSADGTSWQTVEDYHLAGLVRDVTFGDNGFVAISSRYCLQSEDGVTWASSPMASITISSLTFGAGAYVGASDWSGGVYVSTNGLNWSEMDVETNRGLLGVDFANGAFVVTGNAGTIGSSITGVDWTVHRSNAAAVSVSTAYGDGRFVAVGPRGSIVTSEDGEVWELQPAPTTQFLTSVAFGDGLFIAVGEEGGIFSSPDGKNWTPRQSGTQTRLAAVVYTGDLFIVAGAGSLLVSSNGTDWAQSSAEPGNWTSIAHGNGRVVMSGGSVTSTSPDGSAWTHVEHSQRLESVVFGAGRFVAVAHGSVWVSVDGLKWEEHPIPALLGEWFEIIGFGGGWFVLPANGSDSIYGSKDGIAWTRRSTGMRWHMRSVAFGEGKLVLGAFEGWLASWAEPRAFGLSLLDRNSEGTVRIGLTVPRGRLVSLQTSQDLRDWRSLFTIEAAQSGSSERVVESTSAPMQAYRAVIPTP